MIVRLYKPTGGQIMIRLDASDATSTDIANLNSDTLMPYRRQMQMIFQDPSRH